MNQKQKDYLSKRIDKIAEEKKKKAENKKVDVSIYIKKLKINSKVFPLNHLATELNKELIAENRMPNDNKYSTYWSIRESEMYSNYEEVYEEYNKALYRIAQEENEIKTKIDRYATQIKDEVMLGDAEGALKKLSEFEQIEFN